jgi:hypothetical protein
MFSKSIIKKPYMFRSLMYYHPQGLSFVLGTYTTFLLFASSFVFLVCGRMVSMCMCAQCYTTRYPTDKYTRHKYT